MLVTIKLMQQALGSSKPPPPPTNGATAIAVGGAIGGAVGAVMAAACDYASAGACIAANPAIVSEGVAVGSAAGAAVAGLGNVFSEGKPRNKPPEALTEAQGRPHSIIEKPGPGGQYTTHNGDGTLKQFRGSGQDHGNIPRPNVKETQINSTPDGRTFIDRGRVRAADPEEIP